MKRNVILISVISFLIILGVILIKFYHSKLLTKELLDDSIAKGTEFLINNQKDLGNFNYEYDFVKKELSNDDSQVRQAGALWGLSLLHKHQPSQKTYLALKKGFDFFDTASVEIDSLKLMIKYPKTSYGRTGTAALVSLAYLEFLQTDLDSKEYKIVKTKFDKHLRFILSLRNENGHFYDNYNYHFNPSIKNYSPYFDGETLLLLAKASNYLQIDSLKPIILESAEAMYQTYVIEAQKEVLDSDQTKGFYQWSSMAFFEIYQMGWDDKYADRIIDLAYWMIDTHKTLFRRKNTAYAHEGMITAWKVAEMTGNVKAQHKIGFVIDKGLYKLSMWQLGSEIQNRFLKSNSSNFDKLSFGGVMNCKDCPGLRIDVTQHQMHAVILARKYIYTE
jgi:hypothetical protein